jgi:predicted MFS family arabinose efflux permease
MASSLFLPPRASVGFAASALVACGDFAAYTYREPFLSGVALFMPAHVSPALVACGVAGAARNSLGEWRARVIPDRPSAVM